VPEVIIDTNFDILIPEPGYNIDDYNPNEDLKSYIER
jgi:hypothetical protein